MQELEVIEQYLLRGEYPPGYSKTDKANLRRKCRDNFKLDRLLYYRIKTAKKTESWRTCVQVDSEKNNGKLSQWSTFK